jgi:hypothetical protein
LQVSRPESSPAMAAAGFSKGKGRCDWFFENGDVQALNSALDVAIRNGAELTMLSPDIRNLEDLLRAVVEAEEP